MAELPKEGIFGVLGFFIESRSSRRSPANRTVASSEHTEQPTSQKKRSILVWNQMKDEQRTIRGESGIGALIILAIVAYAVMILFAGYFKARPDLIVETAQAQFNLCNAVFDNFCDFGILDVRLDRSVYVYIARKSYMMVAYPDRDRAITSVGEAWCDDNTVDRVLWPKVCLCDLQTGEELGSYCCMTRSVSKK